MSDREPEDDDRDETEEEEEEESPPPPKASAAKVSATPSKAAAKSGGKSGPPPPAMFSSSKLIAVGVVALAAGVAGGWFGQIEKTKAAIKAEVAAAPAGSGAPTGPCGAWESKICKSAGEQSSACQQAKGALDLLLPSTCEVAIGTMSETLAKLKAGRASCDKLVGKLCADLSPGSKTCDMVKERTPTFPREKCDQMLGQYDKVIAELKQMDSQTMGASQMGGQPHLGAPGGGMPHIQMPPGMPQPGHPAP
ncbi:MAG: hypothetical protein ABI488_02225 [Polyangiaceae bacterium]